MCMLTVEKCEVLPETVAWKIFISSLGGGVYFPYFSLRGSDLVPLAEWLQASPRLKLLEGAYFTGFHTLRSAEEALKHRDSQLICSSALKIYRVRIRGIAYYGAQSRGACGRTLFGWTAQEMLVEQEEILR